MRYEDLTHSFQGLSVNDHLATDTSLPPASSPNHQASEVYAQGIDVGRRFRILVTGRLGAGKTTLLSRICLRPYEQRSEEIEEELSHTSFIFHDSVGFESAGDSKINLVKAFIADRAKATSLSSRLHAIWYCIRTDTHMHFSPGDMQFFGSNIAGDVPIIVVFTRFDGLESMAYAKLRDTFGRAESKAKRFDRALELLQSRYILPLRAMRYPPAECVRMDNLTTETPTYADLIRVTLTLLSGDILRPILISVQQLNVDLCMERAIVQCQDTQNLPSLLPAIMSCYPHIWRTHEDAFNTGREFFDPLLLVVLTRNSAAVCFSSFASDRSHCGSQDPVISIGQGSPDHDLHLRLVGVPNSHRDNMNQVLLRYSLQKLPSVVH
ncbi:hypothetical protein MIND_01159500 [Mycena indigotica]|uniref:G domain-containing protein n=1 Tax=Mycena indigotica TaxID=2126181 RepID=A0A8H6S5T9_9AGAR|nr:uncharacterized protein MIND_01159500 [Mycena indigotica]KAF7292616.1 hypothetical protein MIND_01159500 [Mycena indigotica]